MLRAGWCCARCGWRARSVLSALDWPPFKVIAGAELWSRWRGAASGQRAGSALLVPGGHTVGAAAGWAKRCWPRSATGTSRPAPRRKRVTVRTPPPRAVREPLRAPFERQHARLPRAPGRPTASALDALHVAARLAVGARPSAQRSRAGRRRCGPRWPRRRGRRCRPRAPPRNPGSDRRGGQIARTERYAHLRPLQLAHRVEGAPSTCASRSAVGGMSWTSPTAPAPLRASGRKADSRRMTDR